MTKVALPTQEPLTVEIDGVAFTVQEITTEQAIKLSPFMQSLADYLDDKGGKDLNMVEVVVDNLEAVSGILKVCIPGLPSLPVVSSAHLLNTVIAYNQEFFFVKLRMQERAARVSAELKLQEMTS